MFLKNPLPLCHYQMG